ncbi:hypothetical protein [Nevskia sp.]|uniref:hypothetical protein n=1 Tax=Nevskia sp. TaxID=1929292 RepID=UPI0025F6F020|nr:hypothetical protein [Nevskia sp.]
MKPFLSAARPALLGLLFAVVGWAQAADDSAASDRCAANPAACDRLHYLKKRCADDPSTCDEKKEALRDKAQELRERCAADPTACEEKKEAFREKRQQLRDRCDADPEACEQKKRKLRERLKARRDGGISPAGETPPIIPPKPEQ